MRTLGILLAPLLLAARATAGEQVALAGSEFSQLGSYTYAGVISPLGNATLGNGLVMRHWIEYLTYEYETGGRTVDADRYGYAPALGYQRLAGSSHAGIYVGLRLGHTSLSPDDPGNKDEGDTARFFVGADLTTPLPGSGENQLVGELETRYHGYYLRDRVAFRMKNGLTAGPEAVIKGGEDYNGWQAGVAIGGFTPLDGLNVILRAGVSDQREASSAGYAAVEFAKSF